MAGLIVAEDVYKRQGVSQADDVWGAHVLPVEPVGVCAANLLAVKDALTGQSHESVSDAGNRVEPNEVVHLRRSKRSVGSCKRREDVPIDRRGHRQERSTQDHAHDITPMSSIIHTLLKDSVRRRWSPTIPT